ncbi:hypothetical protein L1987_65523 [Smallanthus sonchifolius]|uniref:Uncharacterized protein n=1 Tax=Smallanthus sonchifolius TaxID=185202 RepID=A0ACB9BUK0_9ASTR|nr:hypothetical protein L1987_65523 [Smallanthus sonchifolius]
MSCSSSSGSEEEDTNSYRKGGYHAVRVADTVAGGRYIAQRKLGWGQFSTKYVALKIQKSAPEFAQAAIHEIEVVSALTQNDPENKKQLGIIHTDLKPENILLVSTINPSNDPIRSKTGPILSKPEGSMNNGGGCVVNAIEKKLKQRARRAVARITARRASLGGVRPVRKENICLDGIDFRCKVVDVGYFVSGDQLD